MQIIDSLKSIFSQPQNQEQKETKITTQPSEDVTNFLTPIFREIPPESKAGKYISEGLKSWVYVAVSAIADEVSTAVLNLLRKQGDSWMIVDEHPILSFMEKPNSFQTKEEHMWLTVAYLLCEGEAPWLLNSDKNPTEMVLVDPKKLKPIFEDGKISKYKLTLSSGSVQDIDASKIIFNKLPSFKTPFRGMGKISYITQAVDINNYIEEYLRVFFFNDARPSIVLETEKKLSLPIVKRIIAQFQRRHQGVKNAHKAAVLDNGLKLKESGFKISDLQMKELEEIVRDKVLSAFKVPKTVAGITEDVSRANGENSDRVFARRAVKPLMKMLEGQINQYLLPKFSGGEQYWFEFEDPVQSDQLIDAQINQIYLTAGVKTADEVREELGLEPLEESAVPEPPKEEPPAKQLKTKNPSNLINLLKDVLEEDPQEDFTKREKLRFHDEKLLITDKVEDEFKKKITKFFKSQRNQLLAQLEGKSFNKKQLDYDGEYQEQAYVKIATPFMAETIALQGRHTYSFLGMNQELPTKDKLVAEFIKERTVKVGKSTSETTAQAIQDILRGWSDEEGTIRDLRRSLREYFDDTNRVDQITRTEISRAANFATVEVYKRVGVVGKEWLTARDERTCEFCAEMDGKIVKVNDSYFSEGESVQGAEGGTLALEFESIEEPPLHVNCRCTMIPVFHEEELGKYFKPEKKENPEIKLIEEEKEKIKSEKERLSKKEKTLEKNIKLLEKAHVKKGKDK